MMKNRKDSYEIDNLYNNSYIIEIFTEDYSKIKKIKKELHNLDLEFDITPFSDYKNLFSSL